MTSPQNPFAQPGKAGDFFSPRNNPEWLGKLFIFYPDGVVTKTFNPDEGPKEFVIADVAIVDLVDPQTGQPVFIKGATIGGTALVPALNRDRLGTMVLARLRKGAPQGQKDGAYYLETEQSPQDITMGSAYVASHPRQQFTQPQAQQAPAPAPTQWGQAPAAAAPQSDLWAGVRAAPAGPPQGQWGTPPAGQQPLPQGAPSNGAATAAPAGAAPGSPQWGNPAASAQAAPAPAAPVSPSAALDPQLVAFLQGKGVNPEGMTDGQARMIAATLAPPQQQ